MKSKATRRGLTGISLRQPPWSGGAWLTRHQIQVGAGLLGRVDHMTGSGGEIAQDLGFVKGPEMSRFHGRRHVLEPALSFRGPDLERQVPRPRRGWPRSSS